METLEVIWENPQACGRRCSGPMRPKLNFLAIEENAMCGTNPTHSSLREYYPHTSCYGDVLYWQEPGNGKTSFRLSENREWDGGSPFSMTMSLKVLEWPRQSPDRNKIENLWYDFKIPVHQSFSPKIDILMYEFLNLWPFRVNTGSLNPVNLA